MYVFHPFPGLVFEERFDDGVHGVNVPRLIHKMDSSKPSGETVLRRVNMEKRWKGCKEGRGKI